MCVRFEQLLRFTPILYGHVHVLLFLRGKETFCLNNNKLKIYSLFILSDVSFHLSITFLFSYISPFTPLCLLFYHSCSSAAALSNPSLISPRNLCHASSHSSVLLALLCPPFSSWSINKHPLLRMLMNLQLRKSEPAESSDILCRSFLFTSFSYSNTCSNFMQIGFIWRTYDCKICIEHKLHAYLTK